MTSVKTLTAALATAALMAPAAALAADQVELRGAPTLRIDDRDRVALKFAVDDRIERDANGKLKISVHVAGIEFRNLTYLKKHGGDYVYGGRFSNKDRLVVDRKYAVRFRVPGEHSVARWAKLVPAQK